MAGKKKSQQKQVKADASAELELHAKIKAAEALERKKILKKAKVTIITQDTDNVIDFDTWWMDINRRVALKQWMKEIIKADFKGRGLKTKESIEYFDEALRVFGVKF